MLLERYLLRELSWPFLFALGMLACLMSTGFVLFELIEDSARFDYSLLFILRILWLRLPEMLYYTLPMATLLATLLAVSRLSADHEILVLRSNGMSLWQLSLPLLGFSLAITSLTLVLNEFWVPSASWQARQLLHAARHGGVQLEARQEHLLLRDMGPTGLKHILYARRASGQQLEQVTIQFFEQERLKAILQAERAELSGQTWRFENGHIFQLAPNLLQGQFKTYTLPLLPELPALIQEARQTQEMNQRDLGQYMHRLAASGQNIQALQVRWHQKMAIPFAAVVFSLWGCAVGLRTLNSHSQGLGLSLLMIFGYYLIMSIGTSLGDTGTLPAWLGAWLPICLGLPLGWGLISWRNGH